MNRSRLSVVFAAISLLNVGWAEEWSQDFEKLEPGLPPDELFVIDGEFEVVDQEGEGKALRLPATPLIECGLLFGKSSKGSMSAETKVLALKKGRRSFPRFALGVHGISGYRLRVVPAQKRIELVHEEEVVTTVPLQWESGAWCSLKLVVTMGEGDDAKPKVEGWVWNTADGEAPEKPSIVFEGEAGQSGQGKASIWGTPYSGKDILFDDLKVTWTPAEG